MKSITIEGNVPLNGAVTPSGSVISASKLIFASLFTSEDVVLTNVPRVDYIENDLALIESVGGIYKWTDDNKVLINNSGVNTHRVPFELGSKYRTTLLMVAPLVFRFGKAIIPQPTRTETAPQGISRPINRYIEIWESLGFRVQQDKEWLSISADTPMATTVSFKNSTHMGTENAILSALFISGKTVINNAAEEAESEDLISFVNSMGAKVTRIEPRRIEVEGTSIFKGSSFTVQNDKNEVVNLAIAGLITEGTVTVRSVNKVAIAPFLNVLNKLGANYEFQGEDLTVWHRGDALAPANVSSAPAPGFLTDWMAPLCVLLTQAQGESLLNEGVYVNPWGFSRDLNRMGADITPCAPSEVGLEAIIRDDSYVLESRGEPLNAVKVAGPTPLRGTIVDVLDMKSGMALIIAALGASGVSEIRGYDIVERFNEGFIKKLISLGAGISD